MSKRPSASFNDPGYLYNQRLLLKLFALSSAAMMIGILATVWQDFDREWKNEQRAELVFEAERFALEQMVLETLTTADRKELAAQRKAANEVFQRNQEKLDEIREQLNQARGEFYDADMRFKAQKQFTGQAEYQANFNHGPARRDWEKRLRAERDKEERLRIGTERAKEKLNDLLAQEKELQAALDAVVAEERKNAKLKRMAILATNVEKKKGYNPLREVPLLDFLAPPTKVEQIVLDDLVDNYEFSMPAKVDRCGTCHIGSMRVGFERDMWPVQIVDGKTFERSDPQDPRTARDRLYEQGAYNFVYSILDGVWDGADPKAKYPREAEKLRAAEIHMEVLKILFAEVDEETGEIAIHESGDKKNRKIWRRYEKNTKGEWVDSKDGKTIGEMYDFLLGRMQRQWLTHPHYDDMVGDASPHPYEKFGCTTCHNGRGWSVDFGFAYHMPDRHKINDWMTTPWAEQQVHHHAQWETPGRARGPLEEAMVKGALNADEVAAEEAVASIEAELAAAKDAEAKKPVEARLKAARAVPAYASAQTKRRQLTIGWTLDKETGHQWESELGWTHEKTHHWHWPQHPLKLVQSSCLKCHKEGLYETPEPEYDGVHLGRPRADLPDMEAWEEHSEAEAYDMDADNAGEYVGRMFIPKKKKAYRPEQLERGMDNFLRFGCYGCHKLDPAVYPFMKTVRPKVAPPLDEIGSKTSREWLYKWVRNPKDFRPGTRMPRFWGLTNNSHDFRYRFASGKVAGAKSKEGSFDRIVGEVWADVEIRSIVAWLLEESDRLSRKWPAVDLTKGDAKRGAQIVVGDYEKSEGRAKACIACHDVTLPKGYAEMQPDLAGMASWFDKTSKQQGGWKHRMSRRQGPNLTGIGSKLKPEWLVAWLKDPRGYWHDTNMPDLRLTDQEALDVAAFLMSLRTESFDKLPGLTLDTRTLKRMAEEWKVSEQAEPTADALDIVDKWTPKQQMLYVGEKLVKHYGCFGCHTVDKYKNATPIGTELTEWGSKLIARLEFNHAPIEYKRFDFAYTKMMNPRIYDYGVARADRPLERLKMPRFVFRPEEARDLATFLVGLVNDPIPEASQFQPDRRQAEILRGRQVVWRYNCQGCHMIEGRGGDIWAAIDKVNWRPPDLLGQGRKTQPAWLFHFMKDPAFVLDYSPEGQDRVRPWHSIRMPTFHLSDEEARAVVRYFAALSNVAADFESAGKDSLAGKGTGYPKTFDKPSRTANNPLQEADFTFVEYKCKSCHSEDPSIAIANRAPNFRHSLNGRLRADWIETWLWGPSKLQSGTKMPTFFGRKAPKPQDARFFAGGSPEEVAARQIRALRDYILYHYKDE